MSSSNIDDKINQIINERQSNDDRYKIHDKWREQNRDNLSAQNARKRDNDKKLNKLPGRKQGAMEAAREAVRCAIERGDLKKPNCCQNPKCAVETDRLIFHHTKGYSPEHFLTGTFLCSKCHTRDNNKPGDATVKGPVKGTRQGVAEVQSAANLHDTVSNLKEDKLPSDVAAMITEDPDIFTD